MKVARLAIDGGPPAVPQGSGQWPPIDPLVHEALARLADEGSWARYHGPHGEQLAAALASMHQVQYAWLCCSGTFAVELALRSLGVGAGDEVMLAGYDFPGNFRAVEAVGARVVLLDVRPGDWNFDVEAIAEAAGPQTRAVVVSHLHGGLVDMRALSEKAKAHQLAVVEDACQAMGATVQGRPAGAWGDVGVLSFGGSKLVCAGRGGAILTNQAELHQRAKVYCERGNNAYPLSEMQAAVLLPQLSRLQERTARRLAAAQLLCQRLGSQAGLRPLDRLEESTPAYYKLGFAYEAARVGGAPREAFAAAARAEGVAIDAGFRGFMLRRNRARCTSELANSRQAAEACLVLHHPVLLESAEVIEQVAAGIEKVAAAGRTGRWASDRGEATGEKSG